MRSNPSGAPEIRVACAAQIEPWCFVSNGRASGAEIEAQMLLRLAEPFERFGDGRVNCIVSTLRQMLSDGVITEDESRQISVVLGGV